MIACVAGVGRQEVAEVLMHAASSRIAVRWQAAQRWQAMANVSIAGLTASDSAAARQLLRLPILQAQTPSHHPLTATLRACSPLHTPLSFWSAPSSGCDALHVQSAIPLYGIGQYRSC